MSYSQFLKYKFIILRHAWLNLWDKHMTTGRINQVIHYQIYSFPRRTTNAVFLSDIRPFTVQFCSFYSKLLENFSSSNELFVFQTFHLSTTSQFNLLTLSAEFELMIVNFESYLNIYHPFLWVNVRVENFFSTTNSYCSQVLFKLKH